MISALKFPMEPNATFFAVLLGKERCWNSPYTSIESYTVLTNHA